MSQPLEIYFPGVSGNKYRFLMYPRATRFQGGYAGLYIYAKETTPGRFTPVYIGQTSDLNVRLNNHDKEEEVGRAGATVVCVRVSSGGEQARLAEEKDLILQWQPECNVQHIREAAPPSTTRQVHPSPLSNLGKYILDSVT